MLWTAGFCAKETYQDSRAHRAGFLHRDIVALLEDKILGYEKGLLEGREIVLANGGDAVDMVSRCQLGATFSDFNHDCGCLASHDDWELGDEQASVLHERFTDSIR